MTQPHVPRSKGRTGRPFRRLRDRLKNSGASCWVCGQPIDLSLPWWQPGAFSVDHVVPLSLGGAPLDPSNVVPAHRRCNQLRGYASVAVGNVGGSERASREW